MTTADEGEPTARVPYAKALSGWLRAPRRRLLHYFQRPIENEDKWYSLCGEYKPGDLYGEVRTDLPRCAKCDRLLREAYRRMLHSAACGGQPAGSGCICGVGLGTSAAPLRPAWRNSPEELERQIRAAGLRVKGDPPEGDT